jgi:dTDP-3-amino-3,4,6-trideoxy-alpha-D-glucose transaminase
MRIPFTDLRRQYKEIEAEVQKALARVLAGGAYILGSEVEAFEEEWARLCGVRCAAGVNSGTDALALALVASGAVRPGGRDEIITSPLSAGYTALAILSAGGIPVFSDIDPRTYTLNPEALQKALTPRTRAIVPVHLYGQMADMSGICDMAARYGLLVIEDAAQAQGARLTGKQAGAHGLAAAFSFYPTKNLGAYGDGGAVTSDDVKLIERVKELRQGGHWASLQTDVAGRNSRLDEIQAAVLRVKLKYLERENRRRQQIAETYRNYLSPLCEKVELPSASEPGSHVYHLYVVQHREREALRVYLAAREIETMVHYPFLLHQQPLFRRRVQGELPVAERLVQRILSLPLHPYLEREELHTVARAILDFEAEV